MLQLEWVEELEQVQPQLLQKHQEKWEFLQLLLSQSHFHLKEKEEHLKQKLELMN